MMKQEYKYSTIARETAEKYKYSNFATETAFEYKYQIATETAERNTSKQVSAKETAPGMCTITQGNFFFFFKRSECGEWSRGNGMEVI